MIDAVVLAAGASERMQTSKLSLPWGDSTMIGSVVAEARASHVERVIVVTGFHADEVATCLPPNIIVAHNPAPETGNLSSLLVGLSAVNPGRGALVLLGDMPGVEAPLIDRVISAFEESDARAARCVYRDGPGHPVVLSPGTFAEAASLDGPRPLWRYLDTLGAERLDVLVDSRRPADVNTPDEYRRAIDT